MSAGRFRVGDIQVNQLAGSVAVTFDSDQITHEPLLEFLKEKGCCDHFRVVDCDNEIQRSFSIAAAETGRALLAFAVGKALETSGLSILVALI